MPTSKLNTTISVWCITTLPLFGENPDEKTPIKAHYCCFCCLATEGGSEDGGSGDPPTMEPPSTRPPRITLAPEENITVPTAHPHRITMLVRYDRGFPLSTLVWRKDGEIITSSTNPRLNIMSSGGVTIRSVTPSDRGLYTITVSNTVGSDSASFKLFTKCKH